MKKLLPAVVATSLLFACSKQSPEEYLAKAKQAIAKQDQQAAVIELKNAIRQAPEMAEARFLLGNIYLKQRHYQLAEKEFDKALKQGYPAEQVLPLLSKTYNKTGSAMALTKLKYKQKGLKPSQAAEVAYYKLKALIDLKQKTKAQAMVEEIRGIKTRSVYKQLAQVLALVNNEQTELALKQVQNVLAKYPKAAEALKLTAQLQLANEQIEPALATLKQYHELFPDDEEMTFRYIHVLVAQEKSEQAEPLIDALMEKYSNNPMLNRYKAIARFDQKDYQQALKFSEVAIKQLPEESQLRLIAGYSAYFLKDYDKANQHLSLIVTDLPPKHSALRLLAAAQIQLGLGLEATDTLERMETNDEHDALLYSSAGLALTKQGELVKAKKLLEQSSKLSDSPEAIAQMGLLKLSLNDRSGIQNIESALTDKTVADNKAYKNTLATAYMSTKAYDKALKLADTWLEKDQYDIQAHMLKGLVYKAQQNYDEAKKAFTQALLINPKLVPAQLNLADIEYLHGDKAKAEQAYNKIVQNYPLSSEAWLRLYALNKQKNNSQAVVDKLQQSIDANPDKPLLPLLLAKFELLEDQLEKAEKMLQPFETQASPPALFWPLMAEVKIRQKQWQQANQLYKKWLQAEPKNRRAIVGSLIMLDAAGKYQEALTMTNDYLARVGDDLQVKLLQAHLLVMTQDFAKAKTVFEALPETLKQSPAGNEVAGQLALVDKNYAKAIEKLQLSYSKRPTPRVTRLLAMSYAMNGDNAKSLQFLQQHTAKHKQDVGSWLLLANQQLAQSHQLAIPSYEHILTQQKNNFVALNNLAFLYFEQGKITQAQQKAEQAMKLQPNNASVLDTLAQIYMKQGKNQNAVELLKKAVSGGEVDDDIYINYIQALLLTEQTNLAKRKIKQRAFTKASAKAKLAELNKQYQLNI